MFRCSSSYSYNILQDSENLETNKQTKTKQTAFFEQKLSIFWTLWSWILCLTGWVNIFCFFFHHKIWLSSMSTCQPGHNQPPVIDYISHCWGSTVVVLARTFIDVVVVLGFFTSISYIHLIALDQNITKAAQQKQQWFCQDTYAYTLVSCLQPQKCNLLHRPIKHWSFTNKSYYFEKSLATQKIGWSFYCLVSIYCPSLVYVFCRRTT